MPQIWSWASSFHVPLLTSCRKTFTTTLALLLYMLQKRTVLKNTWSRSALGLARDRTQDTTTAPR